MPYADALALGLLCAALLAQAIQPALLLRSAQPEDTPPPDAPERDPGWCHTHGKHMDDEEQ